MRKVCVILSDRANYGRLLPVMEAIEKSDGLLLAVICLGSMVLERFGNPAQYVAETAFVERLYTAVEGSRDISDIRSGANAQAQVGDALLRMQPDIVLVIGDRFETVGAVRAAAHLGICLVHLQGGEQSGRPFLDKGAHQ